MSFSSDEILASFIKDTRSTIGGVTTLSTSRIRNRLEFQDINLNLDGFSVVSRKTYAEIVDRLRQSVERLEKRKTYFFMSDFRRRMEDVMKTAYPSIWQKILNACAPLEYGESTVVSRDSNWPRIKFRSMISHTLSQNPVTMGTKFQIILNPASDVYTVTAIESYTDYYLRRGL